MEPNYKNNLIIDGHGRELSGISFNFTRDINSKCDLYYYVRQGIGINLTQSNQLIQSIIQGKIEREIANQTPSRIQGGLVTEKELFAIPLITGSPQWDIDNLFSQGQCTKITIKGVPVVQHTLYNNGFNNTYIRLEFGSAQSIKLSEIINYFHPGKYNIFWCVCRTE
jgi:hypothetical protein